MLFLNRYFKLIAKRIQDFLLRYEKITIIKCFCLLISFLFISLFSQANTYYIDAEKGNDGNNGSSIRTAWKTLHKVSNTQFKPGDRISFRSGQTFNGTLVITSSGKKTNLSSFKIMAEKIRQSLMAEVIHVLCMLTINPTSKLKTLLLPITATR